MMHSDNARQHDIERRLGQLDSPEPPADLLDRIHGDIPEYLRPVGEAEAAPPSRGRRYRWLAASVFLIVMGGVLAYRVFQSAPDPLHTASMEPGDAAATAPRQAATEVGVDSGSAVEKNPAGAPPAAAVYPQAARGQSRDADEARADPRQEAPAGEYGATSSQPLEATPEPPGPAGEGDPSPAAAPSPKALAAPLGDEPEVESAVVEVHSAAQSAEPEPLQALGYLGEPDRRLDDAGATATPQAPTRRTSPPPAMAFGRTGGRQVYRDQLHGIEVGAPRPEAPSAPPSTGGTAEPNDQPWGDMFFRAYGTNPFVDTEDDRLSTFGLDVDTGSYTLARAYLERGHLPPPEAIRVEELLNYFDYRDPAPRRGEFTLTAEGAPSPWRRGPRYQLLRIGLHGREIPAAERRDATLVFVIDVSGSMAKGNRLELVKRALHLLLDQLGRGDRVGLVVYGSRGEILLEPTGDHGAVRRAIERLSPGGSTNAEEGLLLGYRLARRHLRPESINRVVLCSDGVANVGRTGPESILERVAREAEDGIELTTVGFGMGNYNDVLMEQLADRGDGNYAYVDTLDEARRVFVENLGATLETIASDAKIQVDFNPAAVSRYRLLGYENRDVADHRFRDDTVDAGEIGAGHRVTALYEIKLAEEATRRGPLAEVRLRYRSRATGRVVEDSLEVRRSDLARSWRAAPPSLRLAALAAELGEVLKRSYWAREIRPEELRERAREVRSQFPGDRDVAQLVELVEAATRLVDWPVASDSPPGGGS